MQEISYLTYTVKQSVVLEGNEVVHTEYLLQDFARFMSISVGPDG